ncbi:MAG: 16S rRNA (uracil(1498)-N(3))-methyltransferase [Metamycoplasmataceae bacterium]
MYRFFVNEKKDENFILSKEILNHLKVIRIGNEKFICVYKEKFYICILEEDKAKIILTLNENHEYEEDVILFMSIIKIKNLELVIQKAVELGVSHLYLLKTKNTNQKYYEKINDQRMNRFEEIIKNASEQSFRNVLMKIHKPINFEDAIKLKITKNVFLAHELEKEKSRNDFIETNVSFFIGPEGGFTEDETNLAVKENCKIINLGKLILRSETAAIKLLSMVKEKTNSN